MTREEASAMRTLVSRWSSRGQTAAACGVLLRSEHLHHRRMAQMTMRASNITFEEIDDSGPLMTRRQRIIRNAVLIAAIAISAAFWILVIGCLVQNAVSRAELRPAECRGLSATECSILLQEARP